MSSCFYCGSNEHVSNECIQKVDIQDIATDAIDQLGYSSMSRIVELFSEHKGGSINLVSAAICELSYEFRQEYDEEMWQKDTAAERNLLDYVISVTRGFVNIESDRPEIAILEFDNALNKALNEVYEMRARLLKAQAQYAAGNVDAAISTITEDMDNLQQALTDVRRAYDYLLARYYAAKGDFETAINYLKQLIESEEKTEENKQYFVKALIDEHFDNSRASINEYLEKLEKEKNQAAQEMMELAETAIGSAKDWEVEVEDAEAKLEQALQQFETESYYGYIDAYSLGKMSRDIATKAEDKQREILVQNASEAQKSAREAMTPAEKFLERLGNPQRQLELFREQFQLFENAKNHLSESHEDFTLDNYCGYIHSKEEAEKTTNIANEIQRDVMELLRCEEEVEDAIANAKADLQIYALQYPENRQENVEKYESAEALLTEAKKCFRRYTKESYEQCLEHIQKVNQLVDELNQDAKFHDLRKETQKEINAAEQNLESIEVELQEQYDPHKFQFAQSKLEEARGFCELRTMEGYSRAIDCAKEVNQLVDEMRQEVEVQNLKETSLREIENARAELMRTEESPEKTSAGSRLNEMLTIISESEICTKEMYEQAVELTEEVKNFAKQSEEKTEQKKRNKKQSILTFSGFLGSGVVIGLLGSLWSPAALLCVLVGGACYAIQMIVKSRMTNGE
ncbi:hypothetical protein H8E77_17845 [bacterium]|nr:hypothetical protein [bacterium]